MNSESKNRSTYKDGSPLYTNRQKNTGTDDKSMEALYQELQLHQIELEMQNEALRHANEQLEFQQLKFAGIYDLAPIGYFILDEYGIVNEVNNAGVDLLETTKASVIKNRLQSFVAADYTNAYYRFYVDMLNTRAKQSCQLKMISKKKREFYVQVEGIAVTPIPGNPLQCDVAIFDITERVLAEQNLAKTKERLELALEAATAGTWELELDTMKFYLDEFNYQICAIPGGKFDGRYQTFISLIHPEDREMVDTHFRTSVNNQKEIDVVCRFINSKGNVCYASIRGHVITEPGHPNRFVGIMMDISEKKRIEEESALLKSNQQKNIVQATLFAEENERKRISDALHDGVSQLLYGIKIKVAALGVHDNAAVADINQLLDAAVQETRNISFELAPSILTDFGLPATIEELAKRLSAPGMQIRARITGFNERLEKQQEINIFRMVQELVNNCMKHSEASLVTVGIDRNKVIEIYVKDNGKGFDTEKQKLSTSGSGLSSIKNRLSIYNGCLQIKSNPQAGTTIKIVLDPKPNVP